jgi:hypothetical protein
MMKVASRILRHHGILSCVMGDLALQYYNMPWPRPTDVRVSREL